MVNVGDAAGDRVFDRDHAEFGLAAVDRRECVFEGRARHRLVVRIDVARGEVGVRSRLALEHDLLGCRHGVPVRTPPLRVNGSARLCCSPDLAISAFTRVHSPSKTGVNALNDALWRNPGFWQKANAVPHFAALNAGYGPLFPRPRIARARSSSAAVSTPSGTLSTMVASMRIPASSARSCSSFSRCSSGEGGNATKRASAARRKA